MTDYMDRENYDLRREIARLAEKLKPHVLTLEEVEDALDTVVWVETIGSPNTSDWYALVDSYSRKYEKICLRFIVSYTEIDDYSYKNYGKTWRVWNKRP